MANNEGVAAVERALTILDAFSDEESTFTLAELSARTGMYKSTVLRLARSLEKFGYLSRTQDGTYHLASKLYYLGSIYQRKFHTGWAVPPALTAIVSELNEGASFYIPDGNQRVCLHRVDPSRSVHDTVHEGDRLPLSVGAAGHVIRAFTGAKDARYERIRTEMYAASFGERDPEIAAVACPVFGLHQQFVGALAVSGPKYRVEALGVQPILRVLFTHARELTSAFGGNPQILPQPRAEGGKRRLARVR